MGRFKRKRRGNTSAPTEASILFPDAPQDLIGLPSVGGYIKPIYYRLFNIEPREGYEAASVEINLIDGRLSRIDSRQVRKGYFLQSEDNVTSLSFDCLVTLGRHTEYEKMTKENWRQYIPQEELDKALKALPPERYIDNSFTSDDNLAIDGLYIKRSGWSNTTAFYFRKTQTGYRLYHGTCGGEYD